MFLLSWLVVDNVRYYNKYSVLSANLMALPLNVGVTPEKADVYLFVAGMDPKALDLSIQRNLLTISGERKVPEREGVQYYRDERFDGEFRRVVTLPEDVDPEKVVATYTDGVLHVSVQRREATRPRQIEIK